MRAVRRASQGAVLAVWRWRCCAVLGAGRSGEQRPREHARSQPGTGAAPVGGEIRATAVKPEKEIEPGSQKINVKQAD